MNKSEDQKKSGSDLCGIISESALLQQLKYMAISKDCPKCQELNYNVRTAVCQCTECTEARTDVLDGKLKCKVCKLPLLAD